MNFTPTGDVHIARIAAAATQLTALTVVFPSCPRMLLFHHRWPIRARALVACLLGAIGQGSSAGAQLASSGASADVIGGWQLAMGASGAWRSNLQLEPSANANGLATAILSGEGSRFWQGRTDRVVLAVGGSILRIPQQPELDRES